MISPTYLRSDSGTYWLYEFPDDSTRVVYTYEESGEVASSRPYTDDENIEADARAAQELAEANAATLTDAQQLQARLDRLAAYATDPDVVAALARDNQTAPTTAELNRVIKTILRRQQRQDAAIALLVRLIDPALLDDVTDTTDA